MKRSKVWDMKLYWLGDENNKEYLMYFGTKGQ